MEASRLLRFRTMKTGFGEFSPHNSNPRGRQSLVFLEHRSIRPTQDDREQAYADASRTRRVLGVLPLDNEGMPRTTDLRTRLRYLAHRSYIALWSPHQCRLAIEHLAEWTTGDRGQSLATRYRQ